MRILVVVLIVVAVVGSTFGDDVDSGGSCPIQDEHAIDPDLILMGVKCLVAGSNGGEINVDFLGGSGVTEEAREFFRGYCGDLEPVKRCLDEVDEVWRKCHNETASKDFALLRDFFETSLEVFCEENGEKLVTIYLELQPNPEHPDHRVGVLPFMQDCMSRAEIYIFNADVPLTERVFNVYRRLKVFRQCFVESGKEVFTSTKEISSLIGKVFLKMKCLHPVRKTFVPCSTLNHDGTGDRECPRLFENVDEKHVRQKLIDDGFHCFFSSVDVDDKQVPRDVVEHETGEYFVNYCTNLTDVKDCLAEVTSSARLCLANQTRHTVFEIFQEMLSTSLEIACSENGVRLATVFFGNYDRSGSSGEARNVVGDCRDLSVTRIRHVPDVDTDDASTMSLRMYQEVGAFEECLARDIKEETFREVAHTFINDVMNKIKCVHPKEGTSVPCKSIVDAL